VSFVELTEVFIHELSAEHFARLPSIEPRDNEDLYGNEAGDNHDVAKVRPEGLKEMGGKCH